MTLTSSGKIVGVEEKSGCGKSIWLILFGKIWKGVKNFKNCILIYVPLFIIFIGGFAESNFEAQ